MCEMTDYNSFLIFVAAMTAMFLLFCVYLLGWADKPFEDNREKETLRGELEALESLVNDTEWLKAELATRTGVK